VNCKDDIDECRLRRIPCAGGNKTGSFCVDYDPPTKFKCGCLPGYDAILPNASDVKDNVPVEWRPLKCLRKGCVCWCCLSCRCDLHRYLTNNTAVCVCNNDLSGDGITNCPLFQTRLSKKPVVSASCKTDSDCTKLENSLLCRCVVQMYGWILPKQWQRSVYQ
jgi:hypothetical protein